MQNTSGQGNAGNAGNAEVRFENAEVRAWHGENAEVEVTLRPVQDLREQVWGYNVACCLSETQVYTVRV